MKKIVIFIFWCIFYILWIFINNFFWSSIFSLIALFIIGLFFVFISFKIKEKYILAFSFIFFCFWILVSDLNISKINENINFVNNIPNKKVKIISKIDSKKEIKDENFIFKAEIISINWEKPKNKIFSELVIKENLKKWDLIENTSKAYLYKDSWNFSYKNFMITNWFYFKNYANKYKKIWKEKAFILEEKIINLREKLLEKIKQIFPENEAIFLGWILLWAREDLPKELKQNFNNSWLTHFIAVSWFNITILILFFSFFIKILPKKIQIFFMIFAIFLFVMLVWPSAPVIRAAIMWFIWYLILQIWRKWNILAICLLTLSIMVSLNPLSINYDISLHLSFLAVFWIIYSQKFFDNIFKFLPNFFEIKTAVSITFSALVFTLPIMIFSFWQVSIIAPLTNLLVSWSIPIAMLFWFITIIFFLFFESLWVFFWFFTFLLLKWNIFVVNYFWQLNFSVIKVDFWENGWYFQIIYFLIIIFVIIYFKKEENE